MTEFDRDKRHIGVPVGEPPSASHMLVHISIIATCLYCSFVLGLECPSLRHYEGVWINCGRGAVVTDIATGLNHLGCTARANLPPSRGDAHFVSEVRRCCGWPWRCTAVDFGVEARG